MKKKIIALLMVLGVGVLAYPANAANGASKKPYIKVGAGSKVTVLCKKTLNLKAKTVNTNKKITYKSSKPSVATVSAKGVVKGKKYGTAVITLKASNVKTKKVTVYVRKPVTSISIKSKTTLKLKKGKTSKIVTKVYPGGKEMVNAKLSYKSSNTKVATVSSKGTVKAKSGGYAKITVSTSKSAGKVCKKYVDVFIYDGFNKVCVETSGKNTLFTINPNWKAVTVNFKGKNGKTYSRRLEGIKDTFEMIDSIPLHNGFGEDGIYIEKIAKNKVRFELRETGESYDAKVDSKRCQMTFYKSLKDSKGKMRVSFKVEK